MGKRLDRVDVRARLELRRDPYWMRISEGRYIGFRKMTRGAAGNWLARVYVDNKYTYRSLGDYAELPEKERFDAAMKEANVWFSHLDLGGSTAPHSVKAACESYVERLRSEEGETAASNADGFMRRVVYSDPVAGVLLSDTAELKRECSEWRKRILKRCPAKSSVNRYLTPLRAALNQAFEDGHVTSRQPWLKALKPLKDVDNRRTLYLEPSERRKLIECASEGVRPLIRTLNMIPMRPGEVAALRVEYLKASQKTLEIPQGKTESRIVPLTDEMVMHFKQLAAGKLPKAWLVAQADGTQWERHAWRVEVKTAAKLAGLPEATVAYTLRHSVVTDLVKGGLDLFHVAKLAGTSIAMIERHYGQQQNEHARKALERLANA